MLFDDLRWTLYGVCYLPMATALSWDLSEKRELRPPEIPKQLPVENAGQTVLGPGQCDASYMVI